jgi:hypothetical protein
VLDRERRIVDAACSERQLTAGQANPRARSLLTLA